MAIKFNNKNNSITFQNIDYKYINEDDKIIIDGVLLNNLIFDEFVELLSNKNIIVEECNEKQYNLLFKLYNSNVLIKKLLVRYDSEYFIYSNHSLKENDEYFEFTTSDNTNIIVEKYYINCGLDYTDSESELSKIANGILFRDEKYKKIKLIKSNKFAGMDKALEDVFEL